MSVNFTPEFKNYSGQGAFRWWCQAVLPLVYDDSLSYMELLNKVVVYLNRTISDVASVEENVDALLNSYNQLQKYVNDYFDNLDVQDEINNKLDGLVEDGTMDELLDPFVTAQIPGLVESGLPSVVEEQIPNVVAEQIDDVVEEQISGVVAEQIPSLVTEWLNDNVNPVGSAVVVDSSLTITGAAADAKVVGDEFDDVKSALNFNTNNFIYEPTTKNLYSGFYEEDGYLVNGVVTPSDSWKTTGYIDVAGLTSIVASSGRDNVEYPRGTQTLYYLTTYNESKEFIETFSSYSSNLYTMDENVKYIRFCYHPDTTRDIMVESGTTYSSTYIPFDYILKIKKSDYVDNPSYQQTVDDVEKNSADISTIEEKIDNNFIPTAYTNLSFTEVSDQYIKNNGQIASVSNNDYFGSDYISVDEYATYYITASANYNHALFAFYDSNNTLVNIGTIADNTRDGTAIINQPVVVPKGAASIVIGYIGTGMGAVRRANAFAVGVFKPWIGKTWVCMGDSLTEVNQRTTLHYHDYVAQKTGITVNNMGKSGTGYAKEYDKGGGVVYENFMDRALTIPETCDVLTIFGSGNDGSLDMPIGVYTDADHTSGTLAGYVNETIDNLYSVNPLLNLGIVSPTPWANENPMNENCFMYRYSAMLKSICEHRSIPFLDLYHCSNLRPWDATFRQLAYSKDEGHGTHPDETGHLLIAPRFEAFLDALLLR